MKSSKGIALAIAAVLLIFGVYWGYKNIINPKIAANKLCKTEENCLKALNIGENSALALNYSKDGKYLLGRGLDGTRKWASTDDYKEQRLGKSTAIAIATDGRYAVAKDNKKVRIFDAAGQEMLEFSVAGKTDRSIKKMVFVPGYDVIAMILPSEERGKPLLTFWSTRNGEFISKLTHPSSIASLEKSEQGIIAVGMYNGQVFLWPMSDLSNKKLITASQNEATIQALAFDQKARILATGDSEGKTTLWDTKTGQMIKEFEQTDSLIKALAISNNGKILASGSYDGLYRLWNIETGKLLESQQYDSDISAISLTPDAKQLAISLQKEIIITSKRVKNTKSYGPKWVEVESKNTIPGLILIRDLSKLNFN